MKILKLMMIISILISFISCGTVQESTTDQISSGSEETKGQVQLEQDQAKLFERLNVFYDNGLNKLNRGVISEGITQLVSILAETDGLKFSNPEIEQVIHKTETELSKVGAGLSMETGLEWMDENKNQISASSIDIGSNKGMNPSIILTLNYGAGKALVSGAPIFFEFVKGSGLLTGFVATNEYGQANSSLVRLDNPNEEGIIRAVLNYRVKNYSYSFKGIERDFVYVPPARKATILVMEKSENMVSEDPVILDAIYNRLKGVTFDFSQYNGILLGDNFMRVFGGDPQAIKSMGLEKGVSYLVMVLNDTYYVNQVELGGKKYNIFKSQTTATTRIIRVVDGKIMYSGTVQAVSGQGGTSQKAIIDGFRNAAEAMSNKIDKDLSQIVSALSGTDN